ncbi:MAG: hypothetical protein GXY32_06425 [Ruminococcaceae bacterium]|nr:hypothetical protein [Oscillospiraceae bacterium]
MEVLAPDLGQSGANVTIEAWFKKEGDTITKGEPMMEISNEKLNQEIEAPESGVLKQIIVQEGESVPPRTVVAIIE